MEPSQLRYKDCPSTEAELLINAPPAVVWPLVCDIQTPSRFSSEFQGGQWLDGATGPALGARFLGRNYHEARGTWETESTICELEPERTFGWAVGDPARPAAQWRFSLQPEGTGTRIRQWMQMGPGESGISALIEQMPAGVQPFTLLVAARYYVVILKNVFLKGTVLDALATPALALVLYSAVMITISTRSFRKSLA